MTEDNKMRSHRVGEVLSQYAGNQSEVCESDITDLLADLFHYADEHDLNLQDLFGVAYQHYVEERMEAT